ncbi:MAG: T9SS type A sorting domain-containing protein [Bacteroidia bacterium]
MSRILTKNNILLSLLFVIFSMSLFSQELVENDLTSNAVLVSSWKQLKMRGELRQSSVYDTINLDTIKGLLDDFSYDSPYPDTSFWLDNKVFINRGYAKAPVSIGAATFDGLNANGYPYNFFATPTSSASADSLTSKPINLKNYINGGNTVNYLPGDSIYFSFYYQPEGRGNYPESSDSLVLEFTSPLLTSWQHIWSAPGRNLADNDSSWTLVMIPIKNVQYLQKGFQFRFRNYATVSGNVDHWHIDYVYLNKFRTRADTIFEDVAFVYNTPSLINSYSAMPWKHYDPSYMKTDYATVMRNNHIVEKNGSFIYNIYNDAGSMVSPVYNGGGGNLYPYVDSGYVDYPAFTEPVLNYVIPALTDTTHYAIECILTTSPDKQKQNDTVRHRQVFHNYYAYDDGTAETAFGLSTLNAQIAEKFVSPIGDTLRCIDIYFNPVLTDASLYAFLLNVWNDAGGIPGTALYTSDSIVLPQYAQTGYDKFTHYYLDPPLYLPAGTFYIGFTQKTTQFLNVGVDRNNNTQENIFYNVSGPWNSSPFPGSLMMHPVFGVADFYAGIEQPVIAKRKSPFTVYPNPANDKLYLAASASIAENAHYSVTDMYGRLVLQDKIDLSGYIDISGLSNGIYFIRIADGAQVSAIKFIKTN